ncbi:FAD-dependent monooxygenase [Pseudoclavibacter sp. JSM 162008]|uniref:FAD-dependent monooxygenase n=1 Tax=Pseudoclavibacter sp. JSM 162008 TaxID=3229855 RepID=UPI00352442E0
MDRRATIIGGGIAGLASALALHDAGFEVTVRERATGLPSSGTSLGMWPDAMAALDAIGVGARIRDETEAHAGGSIRRADGRMLARLGTGREARIVPRPTLLRALSDEVETRLGPDAIMWGDTADAAENAENAGREALIVGADGINSIVRARDWRDASPRALGTTALRGVVPGEATEISETWGRGRIFGITPHSPGHTNWFACARTVQLPPSPQPWGHAKTLRGLYGDWHPAVREVLAQVTEQSIDARPLFEVPRLSSYVRPGVALVGDAAHAMAPNLGRGACESLIDAAALGAELTSARDLDTGLVAYSRRRRGPSQRTRLGSRILNRLTTGPLTTIINAW